jgi:PAS domain S-box-containing protein
VRRVFLSTKTPLRDEAGRVVGVVGVSRDVTDRRRVEDELRRRETFIGGVLGSITDAFYAVDKDWRFTFVNDEIVRRFGGRRDEIVGGHVWEMFPAAVGSVAHAELHRAMADRVTVEYEVFYDPWQRWFLERAFPTGDGGLAVYSRDVTDHKRAEARVLAEAERVQLVADAVPALISHVDAAARYRLNNRAYEDWFGHRREAVYGRHMRDVLGEAAWAVIRPHVEAALAGRVVTYEAEVPYRDGGTRWVRATYTPDAAADDGPRGFVAHVVEITERKRAEQLVRESEERFRGLFDQTLAGIAETDLAGRFVRVNPRYCEVVGRTPEELYALRMQDITHPDDLPRNQPLFDRAVSDGTPFTVEKRYVRPDGSAVWVSNSVSLVRDGTGTPRHAVAASLDITDRKRGEALLAGQKHVLELVATGRPLADVLAATCRLVEEREPDLRCSVLLPDERRRLVARAVGPSLPDEFRRRIEGLGIGPPYTGSCGEVLDRGEAVVVPDVGADERFAPEWRAVLSSHGLRSCRSVPVFGTDGAVLASFALYRREPGDPAPADGESIATATHLSGIAVERARGEHRLRASEERFRTLFESMDEGFCVVEMEFDAGGTPTDYRIVEMNPAFEKHTGLRDMVGKSVRQSVPALEEFWYETYGRVASTGEPIRFVNEARPMGGRWFDVYAFRLGGDGSNRVAVLFADISERRRGEQALHDSEARFRAMADNAPSMLWVTDPTGRCTFLSEQWYAFTGRTPEQDLGLGWLENTHPDDRRRAADVFLDANRRRVPFRLGYRLRRRDGEYRWAADAGRPRFDGGEFEGFVGTVTDIHERRQAEQDLKEADRRKDEFLATLAHELRNPLAPIRNGIQIMKVAGGDPEAVEKARSMMERQVEQMAQLIGDLMDLSRISRGKIALQKTRLPVAAAVHNAVDTSRPLIEQQGHDLVLDVPDEPIYVDADNTRLTQVFANLLNNAAKYTDRGGRIRLAVERQGGDVVVSVEDTGVGIPAHMLPKVFDMFSQVDRSLEKAQGGLGIGLNIVKRLVEMHDGGIVAESGGHGAGSRFVVRLPVVRAAPAGRPDDGGGEPARPAARRRILVVDDNRDGADSLATMLQVMGNETRTAHDGLDAVATAEAFAPDVILMDIGMPKLNGYDACRRIREQSWGRGIVIVAQTGWGQEDDKRKSQDAGFNSHMVKPVDPAALEKLLAGLLVATA